MATIAQGSGTVGTRTERAAVGTVAGTREAALRYVMAGLRLALGWVFLWAFLDKLFGLGHETTSKAAWINGGNPTKGFLSKGAEGPFTGFYHSIAGAGWVNWLFMLGLLGMPRRNFTYSEHGLTQLYNLLSTIGSGAPDGGAVLPSRSAGR